MRDNKGRFVKGTNEWSGRKHKKSAKLKISKYVKSNPQERCAKCGTFKSKTKAHKCPEENPMKGRKRPELKNNKLNWKGGITKRAQLVRCMPEYYQWRSEVFERDNWTCQTCGVRGTYLEAHHIKKFFDVLKENDIKTSDDAKECNELWDINNGVTLCKDCHNLTKEGRR